MSDDICAESGELLDAADNSQPTAVGVSDAPDSKGNSSEHKVEGLILSDDTHLEMDTVDSLSTSLVPPAGSPSTAEQSSVKSCSPAVGHTPLDASTSDVVSHSPTKSSSHLQPNDNASKMKSEDDSVGGRLMETSDDIVPTPVTVLPSISVPISSSGANAEGNVVAHSDLSSVQSSGSDGQNIYHVKWIKFRGSSTPIVMQNQNGPCPLLAIVNVLLLQGKVKLPAGTELVASDQLMAYIADWIFDNVPKHITEDTRLNYEQNMHDAIAVFPRLQTGLDVNVKFTGVSDFEYTPECVVFDLLDIPLVHGWLVDPNLSQTVEAVGCYSYNQLVERIIENKLSDKEPLVTSALVAEEFLSTTASQLTYHGLSELSSTLNDEQLCVLFRNNHFSTLYKHKSELFVLATDQGFLSEPNVVWETLSNVEGDGHFVDGNFRTYRLPELQAARMAPSAATSSASIPVPPANSQDQIDHDYLVALSLEQEQGEAVGSEVWVEPGAAALTDHDLALKLQREEELNAGAAPGSSLNVQPSARPQKAPAVAAASEADATKGEKKSDNCILL